MNDSLGDRMKSSYEDRTRYYLPRRTYTILRLDGAHFHTYTKGLKRPFDADLIADMDSAIIAMLPELQGAVFAYTQSDEISVLLTDFAQPNTSAWFDGNLQKMTSVASSIITAEFNKIRYIRHFNRQREAQWKMREKGFQGFSAPPAYSDKCLYECVPHDIRDIPTAYFDCRAFTIPDRIEVMNYFRFRQQDCIRNSVSMVAQSNFSHKELHGKSQSDMHEMLHQKGINWATDFTDGEKNGRLIVKETFAEQFLGGINDNPIVHRSHWVAKGAWVLTQDEGKLLEMIPKYE